MDDINDIIVKKQAYDSGTVFNINKLNFGWKELKKQTDLENILLSKKVQFFYSLKSDYKNPILLSDEERTYNVNDKILHMAVCLPCYDEEWCEISGTLRSLSKNILIHRQKPNNNFQLHLTVYLIQDGWNKASESLMEGIEKEWGCPDKLWITNNLFHNKCTIIVPKGEIYYPSYSDENNIKVEKINEKNGTTFYPVFITKIKNCQKFNSHLLFFSLCYLQKPDCVFLTDTGTLYDSDCISNLVEYLYKKHYKIIGVTARQKVMDETTREQIQRYPVWSSRYRKIWCVEKFFKNIYWWLSPAPLQGFEFESSFLINTAMFNLFGALPVLPGPCQLIWWQHLETFKVNNESVLDMYFRHLNMNIDESGIVKINTILAEDRILSFAMIFRTFNLKTMWVSGTSFSYEPMMTWVNLLGQRRRWVNGTVATYIYYLMNEKGQDEFSMSGTENKNYLKILWSIQLYQSSLQALSPGFFTISFFESLMEINKKYPLLLSKISYKIYGYALNNTIILPVLYFLFFLSWVFLSILIGKKPFFIPKSVYICMIEPIYIIYTIVNGAVSFVIFYNLLFGNTNTYVNPTFIIVGLLWTVPLLSSMMSSCSSVFHYLIYSIPFMYNIIQYVSFIPMFAFTRIHDISWGNRDSSTKISNRKNLEFFCTSLKVTFLIIFVNILIAGIYIFLVSKFGRYDYTYLILFLVLFFPVIVQYIFTFIYFCSSLIKKTCKDSNDSITSNISWTHELDPNSRNI